MTGTTDRLVTVAVGYGMAETAVTISFLEAYSIKCTVTGIHHASIFWHLVYALGGMEIRIAPHQQEDALLLLESADESRESTISARRRSWPLKIIDIVVCVFLSVPPPARGLERFFASRPSS